MNRLLLTAPLFIVLLLVQACSAQGKTSPGDKAEIEKIVKEYLLANPEVIEEALIALSEKERLAQAELAASNIRTQAAALYATPTDYAIGPADAKVTVVEFFDYRCGFCKKSTDWVQGLPAAYDNQVRVVFKELPIFGGISETAALAALAAGKQNKYNAMHMALMNVDSNSDLTDKQIDALAQKAGINVVKMRADMRGLDVQKQLAAMKTLGQSLNVGGTPGFFVGETMIEGANTEAVDAAIKKALAS
jgi:protein-disulfide isomerase